MEIKISGSGVELWYSDDYVTTIEEYINYRPLPVVLAPADGYLEADS